MQKFILYIQVHQRERFGNNRSGEGYLKRSTFLCKNLFNTDLHEFLHPLTQ